MAQGGGAGLVMPRCTTEAMAHHFEEISATVAPGAHAVLLLDQAGWRTTRKLLVSDNITLLPLPALTRTQAGRKPLTVHAGQLARHPHLSILCRHPRPRCDAWNRIIAQPGCITSIGLPRWAHTC